MKYSRVAQFDHNVSITPISDTNELYVYWKGHKERHGYLIAANIEDLDILITEMGQALNNYRRKKILKL
jgi:hypothetical protein